MSETLRDGVQVLEPVFFVDVVAEKHVWPYGPVYFRRDDALGQEAPAHAHRVVFPVFHQAVNVQRCEQRYVFPGQEIHDIVSHASVSHIYDSRDPDAVGVSAAEERFCETYGIDSIPGLFQLADKSGRLSHLARDDDSGRVCLVQAVPFQEVFVFCH